MKIKLENEERRKKLNILQALKRILLDEDNGIDEIPGLENIQATSKEEEDLIDELKKSQLKIDNRFKNVLKVKPHKLKESSGQSAEKKSNKKPNKEVGYERID